MATATARPRCQHNDPKFEPVNDIELIPDVAGQ